MPWTISEPGSVLLNETKTLLGNFSEVTFTDVETPSHEGVAGNGHFTVRGNVPQTLLSAYDQNKWLRLDIPYGNAWLNVGVQRQGSVTTAGQATTFPFRVKYANAGSAYT